MSLNKTKTYTHINDLSNMAICSYYPPSDLLNLVSTIVTFSNHITLVVQSSNLYNNLSDHFILGTLHFEFLISLTYQHSYASFVYNVTI